ncbi:MAG TPA: imidazolonepropionase [Rhodothermales bacterium]|nr:imidazolonepropionase [Rhodothermales bacterium]
MNQSVLIGPFTQILPLDALPVKGALTDDRLHLIEAGGILVEAGKIKAIGQFDDLYRQFPQSSIQEITQKAVVLPGFVDAHTHACFAGSRALDFAARNSGKSYLEIAASGGGIWRTVAATREATEAELLSKTLDHINAFLRQGVTTIEVKSGYGLSVDAELHMLRAIRRAAHESTATIISTCLAAHMLPRDFTGDHQSYLTYIEHELWPLIQKEKLSKRIDIFIERSAFSSETSLIYLQKARQAGFSVCVHADQFTTGGSAVAVKTGAASADHLEASGQKEIEHIAASKTVAIALPGASMGLGEPFAPARALLDAGATVAIASDFNPGSAPMGHLLLQASVLATYQKLSTAEVFAGLTFRAAKALELYDIGSLQTGYVGDFQAYPTYDYREILYSQGRMEPFCVWKRGQPHNIR